MLLLGPNKKKFKGKKHEQKSKNKLIYYNSGKNDHFAREYTKPKKIDLYLSSIQEHYVSSTMLLTDSYSLWTMNSRATSHITRERGTFMEYYQIPTSNK